MGGRALLRWWRAPLWMLALATGAKSFVDNPILGSERLNERGLHVARLKLAHRLAWSRRRRLAAAVPTEWREQFDRHGFVEVRDFLPPDTFAQLQARCSTANICAREHQQGDTITRRVPVGPDLLARVPALRGMLGNRRWKSLLAYVGSTRAEPLYYIQTILTGHAEGAPDPQLELHSDTFHPSLKAWLFLTDVAGDQGPLTYVAGSHLLTPERLAWEQARSVGVKASDRLSQRGSMRIALDELPALNLPPPHRFAVPANTLVAIDTSGFHARGSSDGPAIRVEIWAYLAQNPVLAVDRLRLVVMETACHSPRRLDGGIVDRLDRLGLKKQHWLPAGRRRPTDS